MRIYTAYVITILMASTLAVPTRGEEGALSVRERSTTELAEGGRGDHPWRVAWLTVEGARTYSLRLDPTPDNDAGVTLILLHGAAFSVKTWLDLGTIKYMAKHGVPTVAVDIPGYGMSPGRKGSHGAAPSKEAWLSALLREVAPGRRIILVSPSMSGSFAVPYIERYGTVDGLVAWVPVAPAFLRRRGGWRLPAVTRESVEVLAIYGELDKKKLPDADVITSSFEVGHKVIVPHGRHPCYLDNPELFHEELLSLIHRHEVKHASVGRYDRSTTGLVNADSGKRLT